MASEQTTSVQKHLQAIASLVIIVTGVKLAGSLVVPMLLAAFLALVIHPLVNTLTRFHIPRSLGIFLTLTSFVIFFVLFAGTFGETAREFSLALPGYKEQLLVNFHQLQELLAKRNINIDMKKMLDSIDSSSVIRFFTDMISRLGSTMSYTLLILITTVFMLIEAPHLPNKMRLALSSPGHQLPSVYRFLLSFNRYIALKTVVSLLTGLLVTLMLWFKGVNFFILWGVLAFLFNFIPNVGSVMAAIPGVLLAILQLGFTDGMIIAAGYLMINLVMGNVLEPRIMGKGLGLSPLAVFLSLVFWGWLLGPVGMVLSVPLTICLKILMESSKQWHSVAILLGPEVNNPEVNNPKVTNPKQPTLD